MSIGLEGSSQKKINLTQLRRNTCSRAERKSGRKAPRPGEILGKVQLNGLRSDFIIIHAFSYMHFYNCLYCHI